MTATKSFLITKGEIFTLTEGEHSDYRILSTVRALKDFDVDKLRAQWAKDHANIADEPIMDKFVGAVYRKKTGSMKFPDWLLDNKFIEPVKHRELHTGSYGETALSFS